MRDEFDGRLWIEHGRSFGEAVSFLIDQVRVALKRLNEIEFDAPWRRSEETKQPHCQI